jgi:hypothetical protein
VLSILLFAVNFFEREIEAENESPPWAGGTGGFDLLINRSFEDTYTDLHAGHTLRCRPRDLQYSQAWVDSAIPGPAFGSNG